MREGHGQTEFDRGTQNAIRNTLNENGDFISWIKFC